MWVLKFGRLVLRRVWQNFNMTAVTEISRQNELESSIFTSCPMLVAIMVASRLWDTSTLVNFISGLHSSGIWSSKSSKLHSVIFSQSESSLHSWEAASSSGLRPLDGRSAGLSLPEQWAQQPGGSSFLISETRFCTNACSTPLIQYSATVECVKQCGPHNCNSSSDAWITLVMSLDRSNAGSNSNLEIVWVFSWDTRVLEATNLVWCPSGVSITR